MFFIAVHINQELTKSIFIPFHNNVLKSLLFGIMIIIIIFLSTRYIPLWIHTYIVSAFIYIIYLSLPNEKERTTRLNVVHKKNTSTIIAHCAVSHISVK